MIIETCPKCRHDLLSITLTTYPPIPQKVCPECGWSWTGKIEEIPKIPFGGNSYQETPNDLNKFSESIDINYLQNWYIDSVDNTQEPIWTNKHIEELFNDFILIPKNEV